MDGEEDRNWLGTVEGFIDEVGAAKGKDEDYVVKGDKDGSAQWKSQCCIKMTSLFQLHYL